MTIIWRVGTPERDDLDQTSFNQCKFCPPIQPAANIAGLYSLSIRGFRLFAPHAGGNGNSGAFMANILIVYSTVDGHTYSISRHIAGQLLAGGDHVKLTSIDQLPITALNDCDKIVIGASVRYGHYRPELVSFLKEHAVILSGKSSAFFTVNLVARKPGRDTPESNPYVHKLLRQTLWQPTEVAVFAGKLEYPRYGFFDRWVIRLIMWLTGGPTDFATVLDYTDWKKVEAFAALIARLTAMPASSPAS